MRATHFARPLALAATAATLASTAAALAQPPRPSASHTRRPAGSIGLRPRSVAALGPTRPLAPGKQALVGWHAPSPRPVAQDPAGRPLLALTTLNRGEALAIPATGDEGGFASADLDRVAHLLRAMSGDEHPVDPRVLCVVYQIQTHFGVPEIRVVSGYRVPRPGSHSNHGRGRAMDVVVPGVPDEDVARFVREMGFVGVGVYPASQFVHVDVRPRSYFWVDYSGPHMRNHELGILGELAARSDAEALARGQTPVEPFALGTSVEAALHARGVPPGAGAAGEEEEDDE
jgi:uncharacterized protein YcbK (DUF882 family)